MKKPLDKKRKLSLNSLRSNFSAVALLALASAWPAVSIFATNQGQLHYSQLFQPLIVNLALAFMLFSLCWLGLRHVYKASLVASTMLIIILIFMPLQDMITDFLSAVWLGNPVFHTSFIIELYFAIGLVLLIRFMQRSGTKYSWQTPVKLGVVLLTALIGYTTVTIVQYHLINQSMDTRPLDSPLVTAKAHVTPPMKPDIYYIILDRYASQETLKTQYRFDNANFVNFLGSKGFTTTDAHANYPFTIQSIASSLNGQPLPELSAKEQDQVTSTKLLQRMIADNGAAAFARRQGYKYIQLGSWWDSTRANSKADLSLYSPRGVTILGHNFAATDYEAILLRRSILQIHLGEQFKLGGLVLFGTKTIPADKLHAQSALYELKQLETTIPKTAGPKMVFAHILLPHPPYVFTADGSSVVWNPKAKEKDLYLNQMHYTNQRVKTLINQLTSDTAHQPIIMLQADEGPYPKRFDNHTTTFNWNKATAAELQQKTGILNAFYLPGLSANPIYSTISPINSFRAVFNAYFDTKLPLLPDNHYIDNKWQPYKFIDLGGKLENTMENTKS